MRISAVGRNAFVFVDDDGIGYDIDIKQLYSYLDICPIEGKERATLKFRTMNLMKLLNAKPHLQEKPEFIQKILDFFALLEQGTGWKWKLGANNEHPKAFCTIEI